MVKKTSVDRRKTLYSFTIMETEIFENASVWAGLKWTGNLEKCGFIFHFLIARFLIRTTSIRCLFRVREEIIDLTLIIVFQPVPMSASVKSNIDD